MSACESVMHDFNAEGPLKLHLVTSCHRKAA